MTYSSKNESMLDSSVVMNLNRQIQALTNDLAICQQENQRLVDENSDKNRMILQLKHQNENFEMRDSKLSSKDETRLLDIIQKKQEVCKCDDE